MGWLKALAGLVTSLPAIIKLVEKIVAYLEDQKVKKVIKRYQQKDLAIEKLNLELTKDITKEQRLEITKRLSLILGS